MSRSISGLNMNTSKRLHIRSTSGVCRDNHRIQQFLKNGEAAHVQQARVLCPTVRLHEHCCAGPWNRATVCFTTYTPNGWRLLIMRESIDTRNRKLDETDRSWNSFTHRYVRNGSLGGPVLKWPGYKQEDRGVVGGFPAGSFFSFNFSTAFRMDMRPDQLSIRRIPGIISSKVKRPSHEAAEVKYEWR